METLALELHASYRCRHSGACCTSGWAIGVEPPALDLWSRAAAAGRFRPPVRLSDAVRPGPLPVLAVDGGGRCVFFEERPGRLCSVHRQLGHEALPAACRHFPRVCVLTPSGARVSLSHFCPTAASTLFADDPAGFALRTDPPAFPQDVEYEGLDARGSFPLLRPGVFLDWESHALWEAGAVALFQDGGRTPEEGVAGLVQRAEVARSWTSGRGSLRGWLRGILEDPDRNAPGQPRLLERLQDPGFARTRHDDAVASVPETLRPASLPEGAESLDARWVREAWSGLGGPVRRYLAARSFASWCAVQGEGLRTAAWFVATALGVLRAEAAAGCAREGRPLDRDGLREAVRRADLLLLHLASPEDLARRMSVVERRTPWA